VDWFLHSFVDGNRQLFHTEDEKVWRRHRVSLSEVVAGPGLEMTNEISCFRRIERVEGMTQCMINLIVISENVAQYLKCPRY
jgi:hypothetical protein